MSSKTLNMSNIILYFVDVNDQEYDVELGLARVKCWRIQKFNYRASLTDMVYRSGSVFGAPEQATIQISSEGRLPATATENRFQRRKA